MLGPYYEFQSGAQAAVETGLLRQRAANMCLHESLSIEAGPIAFIAVHVFGPDE